MTDPRTVAERWMQAMTEHDLEAVGSHFAPDYWDEAPARRGESFVGREQVRKNFAALFRDIPDLRAEVSRSRQVSSGWRPKNAASASAMSSGF